MLRILDLMIMKWFHELLIRALPSVGRCGRLAAPRELAKE
jgi:hypothetical protein